MKPFSFPATCFHIPLLALAVVLTACSETSKQQPTSRERPLQVIAAPVSEIPERTRLEAVGTSRAFRSVTLYPASSGEVVAVNFEPGQAVEEGDLLVELDSRDQELALDLANVRVADAQRLYRRYQKSADSGATLPTTLDEAETALREARIERSRAQVALDDRFVRAPFSGYVGITDVDAGDRIQTSTAITTLDDRSALLVEFKVPEAMLDHLRVGDRVTISRWNSRERPNTGEVLHIDSRVDPLARTYRVRARVENPDDSLRPGQSFRVALETLGQNYPVLPEVAVQWGANGAYAWAVDGSHVRRVPVDVIQRQQGQVLVSGALEEGDLVIVEGVQRMRPGIEIDPEVAAPTGDLGAAMLDRDAAEGLC